MTSPDWPKWEFKDGRKRMTLPIVEARGEKDGDCTTPKPIRLNSTESALKRTKSEGAEKASTSSSSLRRSLKSSKGVRGGGWMSKESTQKEIKLRRSIDHRLETLPDTVPDRSGILADTVPQRKSTLGDTVPERMSILADSIPERKRTLADTIPETRKTIVDTVPKRRSTLADTVPERRSVLADTVPERRSTLADTIPKRRNTLADTILERRSTLPDTVPEKESTVGRRSSMETKKGFGMPFRALENVKSGEKKNEKQSNLPCPITALMMVREERLMREKEEEKRREDQIEGDVAAAADTVYSKGDRGEESISRPSKPRKPSFFFPSKKKKSLELPRRASLGATVSIPAKNPVERREDAVVEKRETSTVWRRKSGSPFRPQRDDQKEDAVIERKETVWRRKSGSPFRPQRDDKRNDSVDDSRVKNKMMRRKSGSPLRGKRDRSDDFGFEGMERGRVLRRATDGGTSAGWNTPSMQDFRPTSKLSRKSNEGSKEKDTPVLVRRESSTSVVPATPMGSEKEDEGGRRVSLDSSRLSPPSASDFIPLNGRKKSAPRMPYFGEKREEKKDEDEESLKVTPEKQLSWGKLASAIYRKTSIHSEISIGSTVPGEFEEEEVQLERERERINSIASLKSDKSGAEKKNPVNRFLSSISLATTRGPSSTDSVVKDSLEDEVPNEEFMPMMMIQDDSPSDDFEIKDTVQEGAPRPIKFTKPSGLGLFRRPILSRQSSDGRPSSLSPPPPSRQSSGSSTTSANPRGRRQIGVNYEDKLSKELEKALARGRSDRTMLKHDNSNVASLVLTIEEDRSSGWGVSLVSHSRGQVLLSGNTAPPEGSCIRVALPLSCVLDSVAVAPTVL